MSEPLRLVQGDNGITVTGTVKDGTPAVGRDLTGATIVLHLTAAGTTHTITATADGDQTTNPGKFTATLTSTHLAAADDRATYEVQVTDGSTITTYEADAAQFAIIRAQLA